MWADAVEIEPLAGLLRSAGTLERRILRFFPLSEPQIAATLRELDADALPFEVTTCLRRGELEVATVYRPAEADAYASFEAAIRERHGDVLFSDDDATIDEVIARALSGLTVATAESCTGGLMAGRLTDLAGSSAYVLGGVVVYSNEAKTEFADVDPALIAAHGAVSPEVARALAAGAAVSLRRGSRDRDHGDRRAGRRDAGQAGGDRVSLCVVGLGCGGAGRPAPGLACRRAGPHDDGGAPHAAWTAGVGPVERLTEGEGSGVSAPRREHRPSSPAWHARCGVPLSVKLRAPEIARGGCGRFERLHVRSIVLDHDRAPNKGVCTNVTSPRANVCSSPPASACSFPRDPQEAGGRARRPTKCQWPVP